ncbi:hypothetical protein GN958_ATG17622 [Phytophthora infestans]|uniref:Uncharacterized protein n=1 Tax=Phytophthora infestans TaxID=4787 RepID=A0A8S9U2X2_PHYIN|nr:hypothetical protein GN958_ATG17622 [Phytophthora infestans]
MASTLTNLHYKVHTRDGEVDRLRNVALKHGDAHRVYLLMDTLRIIFNNLPFRLGEYEESKLLRACHRREVPSDN